MATWASAGVRVWLGKGVHTEEHLVACVRDGVLVRPRSVLDKIVGARCASTSTAHPERMHSAWFDLSSCVRCVMPFLGRSMKRNAHLHTTLHGSNGSFLLEAQHDQE